MGTRNRAKMRRDASSLLDNLTTELDELADKAGREIGKAAAEAKKTARELATHPKVKKAIRSTRLGVSKFLRKLEEFGDEKPPKQPRKPRPKATPTSGDCP